MAVQAGACGGCGRDHGGRCGSIPPCDGPQADLFAPIFAPAPQPLPDDIRCRGCGQVHPGARDVVLVDGRTVSSYSEAWRLQCEADTILREPGVFVRRGMIARLEKQHGAAYGDQLRAVMSALFEASKKTREQDLFCV